MNREPCLNPAPQAELRSKLASPKYNISLENHVYGLPPSFYNKFPMLKEWYTVLSTTRDRNGTEYVSTMEAKKYPFSGRQYRSTGFDARPDKCDVPTHLTSHDKDKEAPPQQQWKEKKC